MQANHQILLRRQFELDKFLTEIERDLRRLNLKRTDPNPKLDRICAQTRNQLSKARKILEEIQIDIDKKNILTELNSDGSEDLMQECKTNQKK